MVGLCFSYHLSVMSAASCFSATNENFSKLTACCWVHISLKISWPLCWRRMESLDPILMLTTLNSWLVYAPCTCRHQSRLITYFLGVACILPIIYHVFSTRRIFAEHLHSKVHTFINQSLRYIQMGIDGWSHWLCLTPLQTLCPHTIVVET